MFINLGDIKGESKDSKHKEEIDILAWSWGLSNSGSAHTGSGAGAGKVNVQDLSFTKYVDKASPNLIQHGASGKHIPKATLTVRKAGGTPVEYIVIVLEEVLVTSLSTGGSGGEDRLTENVTLNFAKFTFKYTTQTDKGAADKTIPAGWNIPENAEYTAK